MRTSAVLASQELRARRRAAVSDSTWCLLPLGRRVAQLPIILAADRLDVLGRTLTSIFIAAGVAGQPDVDGVPALDLIQQIRGPADADKLPPGTGRSLAQRLFKILIARFGWGTAEEVLSDLLVKAVTNKIRPRNGSTFHEASSLAITIALNLGRDAKRKDQRRRESPLVREREDESNEADFADPSSHAGIEALTPAETEQMLRELEKVHPRARAIAEGILDRDLDQADLAKEWGVSQSYVSRLIKKLAPKLKQVIEMHVRQASRRSFTSSRFDVEA